MTLVDMTGNEIQGDTRQFSTHSEWCRWLYVRDALSSKHRRCMKTEQCVANRKGEDDDDSDTQQ